MKQGDILFSSWGWEQTNIDFYEVVKATEKTVTIREIRGEHVYSGDMTGTSFPIIGDFKGPELRRKVISNGSSPFISINSYANAYLYTGKPKKFSCYA